MTFLSKLGGLIVKGIAIAAGVQPFIAAMNPKVGAEVQAVADGLSQAEDVIVSVEAVGQALGIKGPDKAKAAAPLMMQVLINTLVLGHKDRKIANQALAMQGAQKVGEGIADFLNSLHEDAAKEANV